MGGGFVLIIFEIGCGRLTSPTFFILFFNSRRLPMGQVMDEGGNANDPTGSSVADEARRIATWSALATHMTPSIQRVVEFAKRVPGINIHLHFGRRGFHPSLRQGFPELSQDDQLILIKIGFFEVWLGHVSRMINSQEGTLTLADGVTLSKQQMDLIFDVWHKTYLFFSLRLYAPGSISSSSLRNRSISSRPS